MRIIKEKVIKDYIKSKELGIRVSEEFLNRLNTQVIFRIEDSIEVALENNRITLKEIDISPFPSIETNFYIINDTAIREYLKETKYRISESFLNALNNIVTYDIDESIVSAVNDKRNTLLERDLKGVKVISLDILESSDSNYEYYEGTGIRVPKKNGFLVSIKSINPIYMEPEINEKKYEKIVPESIFLKYLKGEQMYVLLQTDINPDLSLRDQVRITKIKPIQVEVLNFKEASKVCRDYIVENDIGSGNWTLDSGTIFSKNGKIANVCYNGRVWALNNAEIKIGI